MKFWMCYNSSRTTETRLSSAYIFPNRQSIMKYVKVLKQNIHYTQISAIQEVQIDDNFIFTLQYNDPSDWKSKLIDLITSRDPSVLLGEEISV